MVTGFTPTGLAPFQTLDHIDEKCHLTQFLKRIILRHIA